MNHFFQSCVWDIRHRARVPGVSMLSRCPNDASCAGPVPAGGENEHKIRPLALRVAVHGLLVVHGLHVTGRRASCDCVSA